MKAAPSPELAVRRHRARHPAQPRDGSLTVDLGALLAGLDFIAPIYDPKTYMVIGQGVGVECHSSPTQPDCPSVFSGLGIDSGNGTAQATGNRVFVVQ